MACAVQHLPGVATFTAYCLPLTILSMRVFVILVLLGALLAACGYKGPLYLPREKPQAQKPAPQPEPEEKEKKPASP